MEIVDKYGKNMKSGAINIYDKKQSFKRYQKGLNIMRIYLLPRICKCWFRPLNHECAGMNSMNSY